jgi:glycosyltransferase involved in cell wall biosynthesis
VSLTYNHKKFIEDTIAGALSQEYPNLEIIISDDCSPDGTFEVMKQYIHKHPTNKNIILNGNEKNMGLVSHLNYLMQNYVHGDIVVLAGGDDVSMPNRVQDTVDYLIKNPRVVAVTGQADIIDGAGNFIARYENIPVGTYALDESYIRTTTFMCGGPGLAFWRHEVWDRFGLLDAQCQTEDSTLRFRALLCGNIAVLDKVFLKYRIHGNNMSIGKNVYKLKTKEIARQYSRDLIRAKELSLISECTAKRLQRKIRLYYYNRELSKKLSQSKYRLYKVIYKLMNKVVNKAVKKI